LPHSTLIPGLQFSMAGIVGRPEEFFLVPSVRFFYETFSYLFMLGLYCSSVSIAESDKIRPNEIAFYIFALGLLWRECLEFRDIMLIIPTVSGPVLKMGTTRRDKSSGENTPATKQYRLTTATAVRSRRNASQITVYFTQDNWNILDTASIAFILVAFTFRMLAFGPQF
ncbi:unnamed protein product, partial [Laminaria digitata]